MNILAASEGHLIYLVILGIAGLINWLTKKAGDDAKSEPSEPPAHPPLTKRAAAGSEEERMRRFLEALGVPADQPAPPPVKRQPVAPVQKPLPTIQPRGSLVVGGALRPREPVVRRKFETQPVEPPHPAPARPAPRRSPAPARPVAPLLTEPFSMESDVEKIHMPDLKTAAMPEFDTVSSHVGAIPFEMHGIEVPHDAYAARAEDHRGQTLQTLGRLLHTPEEARRAMILREIIGPPRSLQSF